jgi:molecular chaperone DnaK (HSP70)
LRVFLGKEIKGVMSDKPIVGIDLGTSTSEIAWLRDGRPELFRDAAGDQIISVGCAVGTRRKLVVGSVAKRGAVAYPERTAAETKRLMGNRRNRDTWRADDDAAGNRRDYSQALEAGGGERLGPGAVEDVVISVPARFENPAREATKQAAALAGLNVLRLINEPTAAALSYGLDRLEDEQRFWSLTSAAALWT